MNQLVVRMVVATAFLAPAQPLLAEVDRQQITDLLGVAHWASTDVRIVEQTDTHTLAEVTIDDDPVTLFLMPHSVRSASFELLVVDETGVPQPVQPPPPATFRGTVVQWPGSAVAGSLRNGQLNAHVSAMQRGNWLVQPLARVLPKASAEQHAVYAIEDILPSDSQCGAHPSPERDRGGNNQIDRLGADGEPPINAMRGGTALAAITFEADVEFFQFNGSSVNATADDIETVMLVIDGIYRSEVSIAYVVNRIIVWTEEPDPYTTTNGRDLLDQFRDYWNDNRRGLERDVAHLMTGRNLDGSTIGWAYIGAICDDNRSYGVSQSSWTNNLARRAALTAHELGHNWDAEHCDIDNDCEIMCSGIGGCTGVIDRFGSFSEESIVDHRSSRWCLEETRSETFLDADYHGPEDGTPDRPYNTFREGVWATDAGGTMILRGGTYDAERSAEILNRPMTLAPQPGTGSVVIGQ